MSFLRQLTSGEARGRKCRGQSGCIRFISYAKKKKLSPVRFLKICACTTMSETWLSFVKLDTGVRLFWATLSARKGLSRRRVLRGPLFRCHEIARHPHADIEISILCKLCQHLLIRRVESHPSQPIDFLRAQFTKCTRSQATASSVRYCPSYTVIKSAPITSLSQSGI
jgi:hypothetical protein